MIVANKFITWIVLHNMSEEGNNTTRLTIFHESKLINMLVVLMKIAK